MTVDGKTYYVRFTAHEERTSAGKLHSAYISEIEITNEKSRESSRSLLGDNQGGTAQPAYDHSLAEFFNSVKGNVSKIVYENGEPLPVLHGTNEQFEIFDISKARQNADIPAFFFSNDYKEAQEYGEVNSYFLNITNPKYDKPVVNMQGSAVREELIKQGFDGTITDEDGNVEYAAFYPNQIKSATDNAETFDPNNPSVLFQTGWHSSSNVFGMFNNRYVGSGLGNLHHGWGHTIYGQKELAQWFGEKLTEYKGPVVNNLYEVDIPDDHNLLHWEKPLAEQPEAVQKAADGLITWDKEGKSNFRDPQYNLRKFDDGSYGFLRSINGKAKWANMADAQMAARTEIKKSLTGKEFYNTLAQTIGAKGYTAALPGKRKPATQRGAWALRRHSAWKPCLPRRKTWRGKTRLSFRMA